MSDLEKETTKLERYLLKNDRRDFIDAVRVMEGDQFDAKILALAKHREEIRDSRADDVELNQAKLRKKILDEPYRDQLKMNEKMTRFVALIMREKGIQ